MEVFITVHGKMHSTVLTHLPVHFVTLFSLSAVIIIQIGSVFERNAN